mmetsp:Transcript_18801/g.27170  ORF Transcript_18801/g.27170 Transcript_18801/m.27170 type:complete len:83 (+) Transcript_18801:1335-1583(+)
MAGRPSDAGVTLMDVVLLPTVMSLAPEATRLSTALPPHAVEGTITALTPPAVRTEGLLLLRVERIWIWGAFESPASTQGRNV